MQKIDFGTPPESYCKISGAKLNRRQRDKELFDAVFEAENWIKRNSFEHGLAAAMEADALARRAVEHLRDTTQSQAEHEQCRRWLEER